MNARVEESGWLSIGGLSRATGIPVATIRTWEHRYRVPASKRKPSGHRLYPLSAVAKLKRVREAIRLGHRPAELLRLSLGALESLLGAPVRAASPGVEEPERAMAELLAAAEALDRERIVRVLKAQWGARDPIEFFDHVAAPFMTRIGEGWRERRLSIRHEHFASSRLGDFIREAREPFDVVAAGPVVALATTSNERHELGLLTASVIFARRGFRVLYLGVDTPVEQLAALAEEGRIEGVAASFSATAPRAYAFAIVRELRRLLPDGVRLWIGGAGAPPAPPGVLRVSSMRDLDRTLTSHAV